jgi:hypothetical protein
MLNELRIHGAFPVRQVSFSEESVALPAQLASRTISWLPPEGDLQGLQYRVIVHRIVGGPNEPDEFVRDTGLTEDLEVRGILLQVSERYSFVLQSVRGNEPPSLIIIIEDIIR